MKKLLAFALVLVVAVGAVFAQVDVKVALGVKNTGMEVDISKMEHADTNSEFNFALDSEVDLFFKDGIGMNILFSTEQFERFNLGAGFAYSLAINPNWDFVVSVGPMFGFGESRSSFGLFAHVDFDFIAGDVFFARLGTGLDMEFVQFGGDRDATSNFYMLIPLPRVAIGWKF